MIEGISWAEWLVAMGPEERAAAIARMTDEQTEELRLEWIFWRREEQTPPPGDWRVWLYLAGRGSGKTRTGAEFVRAAILAGSRRNRPGRAERGRCARRHFLRMRSQRRRLPRIK
jgi:hypothetical protein